MKKQILVSVCLAIIAFTKPEAEVCGVKMLGERERASHTILTKSLRQAQFSSDIGKANGCFKQKHDKSLTGGMPKGNEKGKRKNGRWRWNLWGRVC